MTHKPFFLSLPPPSRVLSPNARGHWSARYRASKAAKSLAALKTRNWVTFNGPVDPEATRLVYTLYPGANRRRDDDNLVAQMKPYRDGIAEALGIDDSTLTVYRVSIREPDGDARVTVELATEGGRE